MVKYEDIKEKTKERVKKQISDINSTFKNLYKTNSKEKDSTSEQFNIFKPKTDDDINKYISILEFELDMNQVNKQYKLGHNPDQ